MRKVTVVELAPAADELWELPADAQKGYLWHAPGAVALPDVASGAKIRPRVVAAYASGKATNVARVFDAFLRSDACTPLAEQAQRSLSARLLTFLPGAHEKYQKPDIVGPVLRNITPGGAYLACLQARDFHAVELVLEPLPAGGDTQKDRRCANLVAQDGGELVNFSPYLYWEPECVEAAIRRIQMEPSADAVALAGSLPLVDGAPAPGIYAQVIATLRARQPDLLVTLDVGGPPLRECLVRGPESWPSVVCINTAEYASVPSELWRQWPGIAVVHDKRGCWVLQGEAPGPEELDRRPPDVPTVADARVIHTICAGDASHGGLLLGLMLYGMGTEGLDMAARLSQACGLTVVEGSDSIRGLTAERVEKNLQRLQRAPRPPDTKQS